MAKKILSILCAVAMMVTMLSVGIVSVFAADDLGTVTTETIVTELDLDANDWYNGSQAWRYDGASWAASCGKAEANDYGIEYVYGITPVPNDGGSRTVTLTNNDMNDDAVFGDNFEFNFSIANRTQVSDGEASVTYKLSDSVSIKYSVDSAFPWSSHVQIYVDGAAVGTEMVYDLRENRDYFSSLSAGMLAFWGANATNKDNKYLGAFSSQFKYADYKATFDFKAVYKDGVLSIYNVNGGAEAITSATIAASKFANAKVTDMDIELFASLQYNSIATYKLHFKSTKVVENVTGDGTGPKYEEIVNNVNLDANDWYNGSQAWRYDGASWAASCGKAEANDYGIEYVYGITPVPNDGGSRTVTLTNNDMDEDVVFGDNFEFNFSIASRTQVSNAEASVTYKLSDSVSIKYSVDSEWPWSAHVQIYVDGAAVGTEMVYKLSGDRDDFSSLSDDMLAFWGANATNKDNKYLGAFSSQFKYADYKATFDFKAVYKDGVLSIYNVNGGAEAITSAEIAADKFAGAKVTDMEIELFASLQYNSIATYNLSAKTIELREINDIPEQSFTTEEVFVNLDGEDWYNKENDKPWVQDEKNWTVSNGEASDNNLGVEYVYGVTDTSAGNGAGTSDQSLWSAGRTVTLYNKLNTNEVFGDNFEFTFSVVNRYKGNSHGDYVIYKLSDSVSIKFLMHSGNYALATIIVDGVEVATSSKHYINHKDYPHSPVSAAMFDFWGSRSQNTDKKFLDVFDRNYSWGDVKNASDFKAVYADGVLAITNVNATKASEKNLVSAEVDSSKLATAKLNEMEITLSAGGSDWSGNTITTWGLGYKATKVIAGPEYDENLKLSGATLVLGNGIGIEFQMKNDVYANYDNVTASVKYTGSDEAAVYEFENFGTYKGFTFDKYLPNQIDEQVYVTLYAEKDDAKYFSKEIQYSVAKYVDTMENKTQYEGLPEAVAALEEYCRATDAYVAGGEVEYNGETVVLEKTDYHFAREAVADAKFAFVGCTINLRETPTVLFAFRTTEDINNYKFSATIDGKTNYVAASEFVSTGDTNEAGTLYYVYYKDVTVLQMETPVVGQIVTLDGAAASDAITYSVVSYAYYQQQKGNTSNLYNLTQALVAYGRAVANFENAQ